MSYFFLLYILILFIKKNKSNIIIPFKIKDNPINPIESNKENSFIHNLIFNTYYAKIEIGTPKQIIEAQISCQKYGISLKENYCLSSEYYNKKYSSSIIEKNHCDDRNIINFYKEISINETISLQADNNYLNLKIKNFPLIYFKQLSENEIYLIKKYGRKINLYEDLYETIFNLKNNSLLLENDKDGKACLSIGMSISSPYCCLSNMNIISYLYKNNYIKDSNWGIKFYNEKEKISNKNDGEFIIGDLPNVYSPDNYNKEQYIISNALYYKNAQYWQIYFNEVYFYSNINHNKINVGIDSNAQFDFDIRVIFGTNKYYNLINENFFKKNKDKCEYSIEESRYGVFKCDKNLNVDNFPSLYFYHKLYNYTYELNYKDLFEDKNDKKYFLVVLDMYEENLWKFGTIFYKKYFFVFNTEEKTIGFYNDKISVNNFRNKNLNNLIWMIFIIISGVMGFFLGKKIYYKIRTKRINELNDNFIYNSKKDPQFILEMSSKK